jgi:uncharacterized protein YbjT (DUF2867 family)
MAVNPAHSRVLVTGASGTTGSRLARQLAAQGVAVTAANRSGIGPRGTLGVRFDWYDVSTHPGALAGAERMYLIPPSRDPDPQAVMVPFLEQAREAGVRRAVLLSNSVIPSGGPGTGAVHQAIAVMFDEWAVLRPSWFMQNVTGNHMHAQSIRTSATITTATGNGRVGFVDAHDIARVAVEALLSPTPLNTDLILTGPEALSYDDVAAILTDVSGYTITHVHVSVADLRALYENAGLPSTSAQYLAALDNSIASGIEDRTTDTVERVTGGSPRFFREFAAAEFRT